MNKFINSTGSSKITIFYKKNSSNHNNIVDDVNIETDGVNIVKGDSINTRLLGTGMITLGNDLIVKSHISTIGYFNFTVNGENVVDIDNSSIFYNRYNGTILDGLEIIKNLSILKELFVSENITAFSTAVISDNRFKYNINNITDGLEVINKLQPVRYKWKKNNKKMIGFIAQDVENILPIVVKDVKDVKVIKIDKIIPYLVNSIKNINKRLNEYERL